MDKLLIGELILNLTKIIAHTTGETRLIAFNVRWELKKMLFEEV